MIRCFLFFYLISQLSYTQGANQIKLRYWNGQVSGKPVLDKSLGLQVSAVNFNLADPYDIVEEAVLSGSPPKFYTKKRFVLFFTVENTGANDVAIYDWAFKAVCPVDNMGRKFNTSSLIPLVTPYIPSGIYIVLKPNEKKQFYSADTDFYWCLPANKKDLNLDPEYFQALITCASLTGGQAPSKTGQNPGALNLQSVPPKAPANKIDTVLDKLIAEHNSLIQKNEIGKAQTLREEIIQVVSIARPTQVEMVNSKLLQPKAAVMLQAVSASSEKAVLTFNGKTMEAEGDCMENTASLTSDDESSLLTLINMGSSGSYSVNADFYTNGCTDCLAVQFQDIANSKTYIGTGGSVRRTPQGIEVDVIMKEMLSMFEGGATSSRVTGKIVCE